MGGGTGRDGWRDGEGWVEGKGEMVEGRVEE